jgi:CRP/FNR family transcriptional regulator, cyclic AMP receptor protein
MRLHHNEKVERIRSVPLFAKLSKRSLNEIAALADEIAVPEGTDLTREGERGREFFVLLDGSADVRKRGRRINTLGKGDFLGEIALVTKVPRTATVTTTSPTRALVITDRDFAALVERVPEISSGVIRAVGRRLATEVA